MGDFDTKGSRKISKIVGRNSEMSGPRAVKEPCPFSLSFHSLPLRQPPQQRGHHSPPHSHLRNWLLLRVPWRASWQLKLMPHPRCCQPTTGP